MPDLNFVVSTLSSAAYYSLLALAIVFVYRTNRILLFCVGEIGALSAFIAHDVYEAVNLAGYGAPWAFAIAAALAVAGLIGGLLLLVVEYLGKTVDHFVGTMLTIAFSLVLQGVINFVWQGEIYRFMLAPSFIRVGDVRISVIALTVAVTGLALAFAAVAILRFSSIGRDMQALAGNRALSALRGVPVRPVLIGVGVFAGLLAGSGGILGAIMTSISLENSAMSVNAVVAAIIGGLTNPLGAVVGALILALAENLTSIYLDSRYATLMPIVLLGVMLIFKPYGLFGRQETIQRV
ncbi:branched-chain amino acid ABC transporter permease [Ochrobactrum teleogrylli]|uniref:branched-chain amino acid ABC transporter permease n=1 Tax=Ochrobactrum teleogrylli TaxID=2479765 RepID=UPI00384BC852